MSSTVNMDMSIIASSFIVPQNMLKDVLEGCVNELGGKIRNNHLIIDGQDVGVLTINNRIVLSFSTDYENSKRTKTRELLRNLFTRRVQTAHENYLYNLRKEKARLEEESRVEAEMLESLKEVEQKIEKSELGFERQNLSECEALKAEIVDAAIAQGYEVVEEETSQGVQLQFIRREY